MRAWILGLVGLFACADAERDSDSDGTADCPQWYPDADGDRFGAELGRVQACEAPGQGYVEVGGDCDDTRAEVSPVAAERCNDVDDDCDGRVDDADESVAADSLSLYTVDGDGDGHGAVGGATAAACAAPQGHAASADDCDDTDADVYPGAPERCEGGDHDCDGELAEDDAVDATEWAYDGDHDGHGDPSQTRTACAAPEDHAAAADDCDDGDGAVHPGAPETCGDGLDHDCDGSDEDPDALDAGLWYPDLDADGHGDEAAAAVRACTAPVNHVADATDCDDAAAGTYRGAPERCDVVDTDCDGETEDADSVDAESWYADADGDGYGDPGVGATACAAPAGWVASDTDCDDAAATTHPGADEYCNGVDDDCDGGADLGAIDLLTWYFDADGDGYGVDSDTTTRCEQPTDYVAEAGDCDTRDATIHPGAPDACDGVDHDCDGEVDEDDSTDASTWYADRDGDGHGDAADSTRACAAPADRVLDAGDCDDGDAAVSPSADETCDGVDQDCDGAVDDDAVDFVSWYTDADGDGFGDDATWEEGCTADAGAVAVGGDCDEGDVGINPGAAELCGDAVDEDCDGLAPGCFEGAIDASADASLVLTAPVGGEAVGALLAAPDVDGDGQVDLLVGGAYNSGGGAYGPVWVLPGPLGASATLAATPDYADLVISPGGLPGILTEGDLDGDGTDDLVLAAFEPGTNARTVVCSLLLPRSSFGDLDSCDASLTRGSVTSPVESVQTGDPDGDGTDAIVMHIYTGGLEVYGLDGVLDSSVSVPAGARFSTSAVSGQDLYGGGADTVAAHARHSGGDTVVVFDGLAVGAALAGEDADLVLDVGTLGSDGQPTLAPDLSGDGHADLLVAPGYGPDTYLFTDLGALGSSASVAADPVARVTSATVTRLGYNSRTTDVDQDGVEDLLVGSSSQVVYVLYGPLAGTLDVDSCTDCARITDSSTTSSVVRPWVLGDLFGTGLVTVGVGNPGAPVSPFNGADGMLFLFDAGG